MYKKICCHRSSDHCCSMLGHDFWSGDVPFNLGQHDIPGARHGDYWPSKPSKKRKRKRARAVQRANTKVRELLQLGLLERELPSHDLYERETEDERDLGSRREIGSREIGEQLTDSYIT